MFVDTARITVRGGKGGNGAVSFHREKYIAAGGPDGGDGGRGGHIYIAADSHLATLMDFRYKRTYEAGSGADGSGKGCTGKSGEDIVIRVPPGTLIKDCETGAVIQDMARCDSFLIAKGGRGGWGNQHFANATRQAPRFAKAGLPGQELPILLELKLLADVGLVGFPNVGKSTLLSVMSAARPKIAGYHFTTLSPNLGVVKVDMTTSFVLADIPGLIEGASQGVGLGHDFLRHVDRCRLLIHVLDVSGSEGRDPVDDFHAIQRELTLYHPELSQRPLLIAANKCDLLDNDELLDNVRAAFPDIPVLPISAASRAGVDALIKETAHRLSTLPPVKVYETDYVPPAPRIGDPELLTIRQENNTWIVEGEWLQRLLADVNITDYESRMYLDKMLRRVGLFKRLEQMGIAEGDVVSLYDCEFSYIP